MPTKAKSRGVNYILSDAATALADGIAAQCVAFVAVQERKLTVAQVPHDAFALGALLSAEGGEVTNDAVRKCFPVSA